MNTFGRAVLALLAVGAVGVAFQGQKSPTSSGADNEKRAATYAAVVFGKAAIQRQLRDPSSASFGKVDAYTDRKYKTKSVTAVCGEVNAKNGFGGYTGMKKFVYVAEPNVTTLDNDDDNSKFVDLWNALCSGRHS
jgi:hypothetical protein